MAFVCFALENVTKQMSVQLLHSIDTTKINIDSSDVAIVCQIIAKLTSSMRLIANS